LGKNQKIASVIFAAGKGSRVKGYEGNKTLLPLVPEGEDVYKGDKPILLSIIEKLPEGPKAIVVNHKKEDVIRATSACNAKYYEQPELNALGAHCLLPGTL
jgi:dTDP-glucose pyrophosphorylase